MLKVRHKGNVLLAVCCDTALHFDILLTLRKSTVEACAS